MRYVPGEEAEVAFFYQLIEEAILRCLKPRPALLETSSCAAFNLLASVRRLSPAQDFFWFSPPSLSMQGEEAVDEWWFYGGFMAILWWINGG